MIHSWSEVVTPEQTTIFETIFREAARKGISFAIGGSLATALHAGISRPTRDLDLYVKPEDKDRTIALLPDLGFSDYYDQLPYDRGWIYRGVSGDIIVDVIWQMANRRAVVDECWISRGPLIACGAKHVRVLPIEELIWTKLYVLQKDRCDWPDILNLLEFSFDTIDWRYLAGRVGEDLPVLQAVLDVYSWLHPNLDGRLPEWLRGRNGAGHVPAPENVTRERAAILDSRPWLIGSIQEEK
ncbi:MAG: hypothetical protein JWO19_3861 [Bryobacterales bacterium]|nr:hypothetical protein [Bryobacterales bacterium]